jgi:hypothetical protein
MHTLISVTGPCLTSSRLQLDDNDVWQLKLSARLFVEACEFGLSRLDAWQLLVDDKRLVLSLLLLVTRLLTRSMLIVSCIVLRRCTLKCFVTKLLDFFEFELSRRRLVSGFCGFFCPSFFTSFAVSGCLFVEGSSDIHCRLENFLNIINKIKTDFVYIFFSSNFSV